MRKELASTITREDEQLELPPGFRFHPTDEELITHYLSPKVRDHSFSPLAIGEVDLNKVEPWDLPWRARMGEKEWYFFCVKDRKYPTGLRTNRATEAGYWKATGKDKEIFKSKALVGMKKTLVFYKGRAPKGDKTNWVMHEYRLDGKNLIHTITKPTKSEWVISRIFKKSSGGKKVHISGLIKATKCNENSQALNLPPLMEYSAAEPSYITCFSNSKEDQKFHHIINKDSNFSYLTAPASKPYVFSQVSPSSPKIPVPNLFFPAQMVPYMENLQYTDSVLMQDQSILRLLLDGQYAKANFSQDTGSSTDMSSSVSHHGQDLRSLDVLWNY